MWPHLAQLLGGLFLALFGGSLVGLAWRLRREGRGGRAGALFSGLLLLLLAGRQATWQVLGGRNERFIGFMQRYDRREFNPAHQVRAGRILDREGRALAVSRVTPRGIQRVYPYGPTFAHVVGYNHPVYGLSGVEAAARADLVTGPLRSAEDLAAFGRSLLDRAAHTEGPSLRTTLDVNLQQRARELMAGRAGAVVLMEIRTGNLLVLHSGPDFDPNRLNPRLFGAERGAPLLNRALAGRYPPGSVFKVLVAAAALHRGLNPTFDTPPQGWTTGKGNPLIRDHDYYTAAREGRTWGGHGRLNLAEALTKSSNTYFARLALSVGAEELRRAVRAAGLEEEVPLWKGADGTLTLLPAHVPELSDSQPYGLAQFAIGQGTLLVSPLQMAMLVGAVANGGETVLPRLDPEAPPRRGGRLCDVARAESLKRMMRQVVERGTGRGMRIAELTSAGKTGTAQTGTGRESHSWYAGFAPAERPKWAFCVMVEHAGYGSAAALPVARELLRSGAKEGWLAP